MEDIEALTGPRLLKGGGKAPSGVIPTGVPRNLLSIEKKANRKNELHSDHA